MIAPARRAAYEALRVILHQATELPVALVRERDGLTDPRDRALAGEIVLGVLRWRAALDFMIERLVRRQLARLDEEVLDILRLSVYQLWQLERVPASAVVNDAVQLTRAVRRGRAAALVNAALRGFTRTTPDRLLPPPERTSRYLAVALSHPQWLVERWLDRFGYDATERWLRFNNSAAPLTLRVNTSTTSAGDLRERLAASRVVCDPASRAPDALVVRRGNPLETDAFAAGGFIVQDEASQLVAHMAGARAGERILDACASPGGKTLVMSNEAREAFVVACDVRGARVALLNDTLRRTHVAARLVQMDLRERASFLPVFDCVLVDAPCTGLGTVRRDPDIKWRRTPEDLAPMAATQLRLLGHAAAAVRPGGRVIYATCSSEPEENDRVVDAFLEANPGSFRDAGRDATAALRRGAILSPLCDSRGRLHTYPHEHGLEAFFAAVLVKAQGL